jgi:hypothetical protein
VRREKHERFVYFTTQFMVWRKRGKTFRYHRKNSLVQNKYRCTRHISSATLSTSLYTLMSSINLNEELNCSTLEVYLSTITLTALFSDEKLNEG